MTKNEQSYILAYQLERISDCLRQEDYGSAMEIAESLSIPDAPKNVLVSKIKEAQEASDGIKLASQRFDDAKYDVYSCASSLQVAYTRMGK